MTITELSVDSGRRPRRQQLPEEVTAYVRELIISGAVRPGEFLRMERIAEAVGVSNTPVREGLLALRSEGLVRLVPRRGFVVEPFTTQDVRDIFWAQAQLAGELAARAAKMVTADQVRRLEANLEQYERAAAEGDLGAFPDLGHVFHREINKAAGSPRLAAMLGSVVKQLPNTFYASVPGMVLAARREHPMLVEALRRRDPRRARTLMEKHILGSADHVIAALRARGVS